MKILFVIASLRAGGAERVLCTLANELCKSEEISIVYFDSSPSFYKINKNINLINIKLNYSNLFKKLINRFKKIFLLRKVFKEQKADTIISFLDTTNFLCIIAKFFLNTPLIISEHSAHIYLKALHLRLLRYILYPHANILCVLSQKDKLYYENFVKKLCVVLNPCEFYQIKKIKEKKENLILFIGRLDENKNPLFFLRALSLVNTDYKALIIGDGELFKSCEKLALKLTLKLSFIKNTKNIQKYYQRAKLICSSSYIEGLPSVLIEAIYFEVARISTAYKLSFDELLKHDFDALIVKNEEEMAKAITKLLEDENKRAFLLKNALLRREDFNTKKIAKSWIKLCKSLVVNTKK